jgi:hypothetical protein
MKAIQAFPVSTFFPANYHDAPQKDHFKMEDPVMNVYLSPDSVKRYYDVGAPGSVANELALRNSRPEMWFAISVLAV